MPDRPTTLGTLRASPWAVPPLAGRRVKDELRANLMERLRSGLPLVEGIEGYDDTVFPGLVNAVLSRHNFILLGLRGQAKSRILRGLAGLLDEAVPAVAGCEIHDDPFRPVCAACRRRLEQEGDDTPICWLKPDERYVEKLATPDVTVADIIGDLDPIRAARTGLDLSDETTMHYGLLPRAHRGIFALNELPDLAGKVQVSLFNIMQEGDVQIKGYPVRLPLDVALVFTANPEDYTARGKIITPLKDRLGSEIRTHYPAALEIGMKISENEAWLERGGIEVAVPDYVREVVEGLAFAAREDSRVDKRSGVSQRLPISCLENVVSNAERRGVRLGQNRVRARIADIHAALPAVTGKLELEYEGEMRGAETVARELVRKAVAGAIGRRIELGWAEPVVAWFEQGNSLRLDDDAPDEKRLAELSQVPRLSELSSKLAASDDQAELAGAGEFLLEGLWAHKKIGRSEEKVYTRAEPSRRKRRSRGLDLSGGIDPDWGGGIDDETMQ